MSEQMVREHDRLGPLQMGVARKDRPLVTLRLRKKSRHQLVQACLMSGYRRSQVQLQVECDLVVAATTSVHLATHRSHQLDQPPLYGHVDVLILECPLERPALYLAGDSGQPGKDRISFGFTEHSDGSQHAHMSLRPLDIKGRKHMVEQDRRVQALEEQV
jgi:hypothetical protein